LPTDRHASIVQQRYLQQFLAFFFPAIAADIFQASNLWPARKDLSRDVRKAAKKGVRKGCSRGSLWFWRRGLGNQFASCCREFALSKTSLRCVRYRGY